MLDTFRIELERSLAEAFPFRSQLKHDYKKHTGCVLKIDGHLLGSVFKSKDNGTDQVVRLIKEKLPQDVYLLDEVTGHPVFHYPTISKGGRMLDYYHIAFGSDDWPSIGPTGFLGTLMAIFKKDPTTWVLSCEITKEIESFTEEDFMSWQSARHFYRKNPDAFFGPEVPTNIREYAAKILDVI